MKLKYIALALTATWGGAAHAEYTYQQLITCLMKDECITYNPEQGELIDNGAEPWFYPVQGTDYGSILTIQSSTQEFIASNIGTGDLIVYGFTMKDRSEAFQYGKSDCPLNSSFVLRPGAACTVNVKFKPPYEGDFNSTLRLIHSSTIVPAVEKYIEGSGVQPTPEQLKELEENLKGGEGIIPIDKVPKSDVSQEEIRKGLRLSSSVINFGTVPVGTSVPSQSVQVFNDTDTPLHVYEVASGRPDFVKATQNCYPEIPAGGSCTVTANLTASSITKAGLDSPLSIRTSEGVDASIRVTANIVGARITASPNPFAITATSATDEKQASLYLANTGNMAVSISGVGVSNNVPVAGMLSGATFATNTRIVSQNCTAAPVPADGSCTIVVGYKNSNETAELGSITYNVDGKPQSVKVAAKMILPDLALLENGHDFGNVKMGSSSSKVFTIKNVGNKVVNLTAISPQSAFLVVDGKDCIKTFQIGETCPITLTFKGDVLNQTVRNHGLILTNTGDLEEVEAYVSGKSVGAHIATSPSSLQFGKVEFSTTSKPVKWVTLTNKGNETLTNLTLSSENALYRVVAGQVNDCTTKTQLTAGSSCQFGVEVDASSPTSKQVVAGNIRISSDATNTQPTPLMLVAEAEVIGGVLQAAPTDIPFGTVAYGSTQERTVVITNTGIKPATLQGVESGATQGIGLLLGTCKEGTVIPPNGTCSLKVVMDTSPVSKNGAYGSFRIIADTAKGGVGVSASGITQGSYLVVNTPYILPASKVGLKALHSVQFYNAAYTALTITNAKIVNGTNGTWGVKVGQCATAYQQHCSITVEVTPQAYGETRANLVVETNDARYPTLTVPLIGSAYAGDAAIYLDDKISTTYDFGKLKIGQSKSVNGKIVNHGAQTLKVTGLYSNHWTVSNGCINKTLAPNAACTFTVSRSMGATTSNAPIVSYLEANFENDNPLRVSLQVTPEGSVATLNKEGYDFESQVYQVLRATSFNITNNGASPLVFNGPWNSDPNKEYVITDSCGASLPSGATCTANVSFAPFKEGQRDFTFERNSDTTGSKLAFNVTGVGLVANPVALAQITGAAGTTHTVPLTIVNKGSAGMVVQKAELVNGGNYGATLSNPNNCQAISSFTACTYSVKYTMPSSSVGPLKIKLTYTGGPSPKELEVAITDEDIAPSCLAVKNADPDAISGTYLLNKSGNIVEVYCDQETDGGGWELAYVNSYDLAQANPSSPLKLIPYNALVKGQLMITGSAIPGIPALPNGMLNTYDRVLIKGGTSTWQSAVGSWISFDTLKFSSPGFVSPYFANARSEKGITTLGSGNLGWTDYNLPAGDLLTIGNAYSNKGICGGAGIPKDKNCMAFNTVGSFLDNNSTHFEVRSYREMYFR